MRTSFFNKILQFAGAILFAFIPNTAAQVNASATTH